MANPYTYTAREYDPETGLYYYRARYYDAAAGRFLQEDPFGFGAGVNFYAYVNNNPINLIDPMGLLTIGGEEGNFLLRFFETIGGEPFRLQWRFGGNLHHLGDHIKWGFHYANQNAHYYWNRMVVEHSGRWVVVAYPLLGKTAGVIVVGTAVAGSAYIGWSTGKWITGLSIPNLVDNKGWDINFGNAFVPSSWNWGTKRE